MTVTDDEESQTVKINQEVEGLEPLDFRQDWSKEMIDTFGKMESCFQLEQVIR
jgi:hypothetical protein